MTDPTPDILALARALIRIPSVTVGERIRLDEVRRAADFITGWMSEGQVEVRRFDEGDYPAILAGFPGRMQAPVMLSGHYDVVAPEPDDGQFLPHVEGDYLWGRGSADMKTVVATYMVWLRDRVRQGPPFPRVNLLLAGNEETGETEPMGTGHVLSVLESEAYRPDILIAGERTEESGRLTWGQVCTQNRGIARFRVTARGARAHSGMAAPAADLNRKLSDARARLTSLAEDYLTLEDSDGWRSQIRFPFVQVGVPGVYNITPDHGVLGVEIRAIPGDRLDELFAAFEDYAVNEGLEIGELLEEPGSACDPANAHLQALLSAVEAESGAAPVVGRKLAGTSARFAPGGMGLVWGQSGIGPHSAEERHFIPSIAPYYRALDRFSSSIR